MDKLNRKSNFLVMFKWMSVLFIAAFEDKKKKEKKQLSSKLEEGISNNDNDNRRKTKDRGQRSTNGPRALMGKEAVPQGEPHYLHLDDL